MPYESEFASGESLIALQNNPIMKAFEGVIAVRGGGNGRDPAPVVAVERRDWLPRRILAIDGSSITEKIQNGFPGAEVSLVTLAAVFIDVKKVAGIRPGEMPSPAVFNSFDTAQTHCAVLPGANIRHKDDDTGTSRDFFRSKVYEALNACVAEGHETLLETLRAIDRSDASGVDCPVEGCAKKLERGEGLYACSCPAAQTLFETDVLRIHERFSEAGSNGDVHGEVRHVLEVLALVNLLRFFEKRDIRHLKEVAFVMDGPLAVFGQPAKIAPQIRAELMRIGEASRRANGVEPLVIGIEKSGQYVSHFEDLDWTDTHGPRSRFDAGTVLIPDSRYINRNITLRPEDARASGTATYFGRKVFYKTAAGAHAVLNVAMTNEDAADFTNADAACFPRLADALSILDHLSTYLYQDGFMPLVRAHAHAAIPLKRGSDILKGIVE